RFQDVRKLLEEAELLADPEDSL
ncbi:MAG: hypothetical protein RL011_1778, partial [Pseudomonadota bacterium]